MVGSNTNISLLFDTTEFLSQEKQGLVLVLFLLLFVIGVPLTLLYCMQLGLGQGRFGKFGRWEPVEGDVLF